MSLCALVVSTAFLPSFSCLHLFTMTNDWSPHGGGTACAVVVPVKTLRPWAVCCLSQHEA